MKDGPLLCLVHIMKKELCEIGRPCQLLGDFGWILRCSRTIFTFFLEVPDLGRPEYFLFKFKHLIPSFLNLRMFLCMVDVESTGVLGNLIPNFRFTSLMLWQWMQVQTRKLRLSCPWCILISIIYNFGKAKI